MQGDVLVEEIGEDGEVITPLSELEPAVRKRVLYLKQLQDDYDTKEKEYLREIRKLDQKYAPIYGEEIYPSFIFIFFIIKLGISFVIPASQRFILVISDHLLVFKPCQNPYSGNGAIILALYYCNSLKAVDWVILNSGLWCPWNKYQPVT